MKNNDQFETLLKSYTVTPASKNFANNIIKAAMQHKQKQSLFKYLNKLFADFYIPAPAYSMASLLIVSFIISYETYESYTHEEQTNIIEQLLEEETIL